MKTTNFPTQMFPVVWEAQNWTGFTWNKYQRSSCITTAHFTSSFSIFLNLKYHFLVGSVLTPVNILLKIPSLLFFKKYLEHSLRLLQLRTFKWWISFIDNWISFPCDLWPVPAPSLEKCFTVLYTKWNLRKR